MSIKPLENSNLYCIFCEDIRSEVDGKSSIVGWFSDGTQIMMGGNPMLLPKFSMVGILTVPKAKQPSELKLDLMKDEEVFQSISIPQDKMAEAKKASSANPTPMQAVALRLAIQTANFLIDRPCTLRMRVQFDDTELYSNGLQFVA